jgi:hypothetical protein
MVASGRRPARLSEERRIFYTLKLLALGMETDRAIEEWIAGQQKHQGPILLANWTCHLEDFEIRRRGVWRAWRLRVKTWRPGSFGIRQTFCVSSRSAKLDRDTLVSSLGTTWYLIAGLTLCRRYMRSIQ